MSRPERSKKRGVTWRCCTCMSLFTAPEDAKDPKCPECEQAAREAITGGEDVD